MKKIMLAVSIFVMFSAALCAMESPMESQQCAKMGCSPALCRMEPQQLVVIGCGKVACTIDLVDIQFSISVQGSDAESSKRKQDKILAKVNKYIREKGFPDGVLFLQGSVLQRQKSATGKSRDDYYLARSAYLMRTDRVQDTNALQVELVEIGVDEIQSVTLLSSKQRQFEDEARRLALQDAMEKADITAKTLGVKLGKPVNVYYEAPVAASDNSVEVVVKVVFSYQADTSAHETAPADAGKQ